MAGRHNIQQTLEGGRWPKAGSTPRSYAKSGNTNRLAAYGTSAPSAAAGYSPGGFFQKADGSVGACFYINEGSATSCDFRAVLTSGSAIARSLSAQTTENYVSKLSLTTDSTYLSGTNITYGGGLGSSTLRLVGVWTGTAGGFCNIHSRVDMSGVLTAATGGAIGIKSVVENTAAQTLGNIYGGQFIARHNDATNTVANECPIIGLEGYAYVVDAGQAGTMIGINAAIHNESTGTAISGSVHRALRVVCDNASGATKADESTGICIWNMAGTWDNAINVVGDFTFFAKFTGTAVAAAGKTLTSTYAIPVKTPNGATAYIFAGTYTP